MALTAEAEFCAAWGAAVIQGPVLRVSVPEQIAKRAKLLAGRVYVLEEVIHWMEKSHERLSLITGGPGCGQTTLVAWFAGGRGNSASGTIIC